MTCDYELESLPEGVLENVLLKLPYVAVVLSKQVCKKWEQVIVSHNFAQSYRDTVKLVEKVSSRREFTYEIVDSSNSVLPYRPQWNYLGSITCHINGLVLIEKPGKFPGVNFPGSSVPGLNPSYFIGNMFTDEWEEIPTPPGGFFYPRNVAIFYTEDQQYQLVCWENCIMTLVKGKTEWDAIPDTMPAFFTCCTNTVVINNSIFCVRHVDGILMEYESVQGKFSTLTITNLKDERLHMVHRFCAKLMVWQRRLYFLMLNRTGNKTLEIWQISRDDGRASFVGEFDMDPRVKRFEIKEIEDDGLLHVQGCYNYDIVPIPSLPVTVVSMVYNMVSKSVEVASVTNTYTTRLVPVQVRLQSAYIDL